MNNNALLNGARKVKNDEFYTRYDDIAAELGYYTEYLKGKVVYCNCDDPSFSQFWFYFRHQFKEFQLKKLIATHLVKGGCSCADIYDGKVDIIVPLNGDGDFRSEECRSYLNEADVVVTNPPFSLFREFIALLVECRKDFIVMGTINALKYKDIFPLIIKNKIMIGQNFNKKITFDTLQEPSTITNIAWYTTFPIRKNQEWLTTKASYYNEAYKLEAYPRYDNYDAINVDKVINIPMDYEGIMGVPISFIGKYNPEQFKLVGEANSGTNNEYDLFKPLVNGKQKYVRFLIQNLHPERGDYNG